MKPAPIKKITEIEGKIVNNIKGSIGTSVRINLVEPNAIARSEGKARRIIDERPKA